MLLLGYLYVVYVYVLYIILEVCGSGSYMLLEYVIIYVFVCICRKLVILKK